MPVWAWIAAGVAIPPVLAALLFRVHYRFDWDGGKKWSVNLAYGFPGFKRSKIFPPPVPPDAKAAAPRSAAQAGFIRIPRFRLDKERARRALFRFLTDGPALGAVIRYVLRLAGLAVRLLRPTLACAVGHPDPLRLARLCSACHAARALPLMRRVRIYPRFQDRASTLRLQINGDFSAARAVLFLAATLWAFPAFTLLRRTWHGWRNSELRGWRAFAFSRLAGIS